MFEPTPVFSAESPSLPPGAAPGSDLPRPKRRVHGRLQRLCELYGSCDAMRSLFDTLDRVAGASATVIGALAAGSSRSGGATSVQIGKRARVEFGVFPGNSGSEAPACAMASLGGRAGWALRLHRPARSREACSCLR